MKRWAVFLLLVFCLPAVAQFTTVTGTVTDPNGLPYANGTIVPTLLSSASPTLNGLAYTPPAGPVGLDTTGSFTMNLASQSSLSPGGTTWSFNVCSGTGTIQPDAGTGPQCFVVTGIVITGASQSISAQLQAAALSLIKAVPAPGANIVRSGLIAEYRMTENSGSTLTDFSGSANSAVFPGGSNNPTWVGAPTGGLSFSAASSQVIQLPVALQAARTVQIFYRYQNSGNTLNGLLINTGGANALEIVDSCYMVHSSIGCTTAGKSNLWALANNGGTGPARTQLSANGSGLVTWLLGSSGDSTCDNVYSQTEWYQYPIGCNTAFAGSTTPWKLGGISGGNFYTGQMYYAVFYNRYLSQAEVTQNVFAISSAMANRGVPVIFGTTNTSDLLIAHGDSITNGFDGGSGDTYTAHLSLAGASWNISNEGIGGWDLTKTQTGALTGSALITQQHLLPTSPYGSYTGSRNAVIVWLGTNDIATASQSVATTYAGLTSYCRVARVQGYKCIVATMISRFSSATSWDTQKNQYNLLIRTNWTNFADGEADIAADPNLGADGANANATFFLGDRIHPTQGSVINDEAPVMQRAVNRAFGNTTWSTANTYTTGAAAASAITAASESTNTVTITSTLNPPVNSQVFITGVTPSGYNGVYTVLTTAAGNFTYFNYTSGLGAGTVFGTAMTPLQQDADVYVRLGGSAVSPSFTLEDCIGYTGQNLYLKNENTTSPWVLTPFNSETIDGASSLTMPTATSGNNPVVVLQSFLTSPSAAGCSWKRLQ